MLAAHQLHHQQRAMSLAVVAVPAWQSAVGSAPPPVIVTEMRARRWNRRPSPLRLPPLLFVVAVGTV